MKTIRGACIVFSAFFTISHVPFAVAGDGEGMFVERLNLSDTVQQILERAPEINQAKERVQAAEAGWMESRLGRLPRLTAKSAATRGDSPVYAFSSLLEQRRFGPQNFAIDALNHPGYLTNIHSSLELGVPLFAGFALTDREKLARLETSMALAGLDSAKQSAVDQAVEVYLKILLGKALLENVNDRIQSASVEIESARRLRARGLVLGSDFYAAEAVLAGLQADRLRLKNEQEGSRATLAVLLHSSTPIEAMGNLEGVQARGEAFAPWLESASKNRQDLAQAALGESAAVVLERRESLSLLPTVEAFAALETDTYDFGSNPTNRIVGVRASLPIGDPTYFERKKRAGAARQAARAGKEALEQGIHLELEQRFREYQAALEMAPVLRDAADKAKQSLELFRPLYREGRQSILDVLRAEDALAKVRAGYLENLFRVHAGYARLALAAGRLDLAAIKEIEARLGGAK